MINCLHYINTHLLSTVSVLQNVLLHFDSSDKMPAFTDCVSREEKSKFPSEEIPTEGKQSVTELRETCPYKALLQLYLMIHLFFLSLSLSLSVTQGKLHEDVREQPTRSAPPPQKVSSEERKQRWEAGQIDYMGDDSFANIERKLDSFLK